MADPVLVKETAGKARAQLGKSYAIGGPDDKGGWIVRGKPLTSDQNPREFDCSGFSKWVLGQMGIDLPDGCALQIQVCRKLSVMEAPQPLDLGFACLHGRDETPDHVVLRLDDQNVIEARGFQAGHDYNKVIIRPVSAWEAQAGWLGWHRAPGL